MRLSMNGDVTLNTIRLNKLGRNNFPIHRSPSPLRSWSRIHCRHMRLKVRSPTRFMSHRLATLV